MDFYDRNEEIIALFESGISRKDLAEKFDLSKQRICKIVGETWINKPVYLDGDESTIFTVIHIRNGKAWITNQYHDHIVDMSIINRASFYYQMPPSFSDFERAIFEEVRNNERTTSNGDRHRNNAFTKLRRRGYIRNDGSRARPIWKIVNELEKN